MPTRADVRAVSRGEARGAIAKAEEFLGAAIRERDIGKWDSAGLNAIHAGIAAADAACIASAGVTSASRDHSAVIALLDVNAPEFAATQRRQLGGLLKMKNAVAYERRPLTEVESRQLVDHAQRLVAWARRVTDAHVG